MKVSVSSWSYRAEIDSGRMDLHAFIDEVADIGADGFEIFLEHLDSSDLDGAVQRAADHSERLGLTISTLITRNDFSRPTARERADEVESMKAWIRRAASAGIRRLNVFTGNPSDEDPSMDFHRIVDSYSEVVSLAEENCILLCLENVLPVCRSAEEMLAVIDAVGSDHLRTNPDLYNLGYPGVKKTGVLDAHAYKQLALLAPRASNVHVRIETFTDTGDLSYVDMARVMGILRDACYDDHLVMETGPISGVKETCVQGLAAIRRHLDHAD